MRTALHREQWHRAGGPQQCPAALERFVTATPTSNWPAEHVSAVRFGYVHWPLTAIARTVPWRSSRLRVGGSSCVVNAAPRGSQQSTPISANFHY